MPYLKKFKNYKNLYMNLPYKYIKTEKEFLNLNMESERLSKVENLEDRVGDSLSIYQ